MSMNVTNLETLYIAQLKDAYSAETQLTQALPKMIERARSDDLRLSLEEHLEETRGQLERIKTIFKTLDFKPGGETCAAMKGLVEEAEELVNEHVTDESATDAAIICACQKIEHYEIATYGTLCKYAESLGRDEDKKLLGQTLNQEKAADKKLSDAALGFANAAAASA